MSVRDLIVIGGGEHARVVMDAALTRPDCFRLIGYTDLTPVPETDSRFSTRWLGTDEGARDRFPDASFVLGVGGVGRIDLRARLVHAYGNPAWANVIHVNAAVARSTTFGAGIVVFAGVCINTGARIGNHAIVNTGAIIEHDVSIGEMSQIAPGGMIGGGTEIGRDAYLGLGCRVRDHVRIGQKAVIGMGSVVVRDVSEGETVLGNPAKSRGNPRGSRT